MGHKVCLCLPDLLRSHSPSIRKHTMQCCRLYAHCPHMLRLQSSRRGKEVTRRSESVQKHRNKHAA